VSIGDYNPPRNFRAISLATLRHVLDSYHAITPLSWYLSSSSDFHWKSKVCRRNASTRVSIFIFIILHARKTTFLQSLGIVTLESLSEMTLMLFQKLQWRQQRIRTRKLALKNVKYFWALQKFSFTSQPVKVWSNHCGFNVKPIRLTPSQQSRPFVNTGFLRAV